MQAVLAGTLILSLVGKQGAGKTTIGTKLARSYGIEHIEASAVVQAVCGNLRRSDMPSTNARTASEPDWLGNAIADRISNFTSYVVLTGVREVEVHSALMKQGAFLWVCEIKATESQRFERHKGKKCETLEEFKVHEQNEYNIGLGAVIETAHFTVDTTGDTVNHAVAKIQNQFG